MIKKKTITCINKGCKRRQEVLFTFLLELPKPNLESTGLMYTNSKLSNQFYHILINNINLPNEEKLTKKELTILLMEKTINTINNSNLDFNALFIYLIESTIELALSLKNDVNAIIEIAGVHRP